MNPTTNTPAPVLPTDVHALLSDPAQPDIERLTVARRWLDELDPTAWIADLAARLQTDRHLAVQLGQQSVAHPNGFDLITLAGGLPTADRLPPYRLRLHIWWQAGQTLEDVHNHAWDFCSRILTGSLRFTTYHPTASENSLPEFHRYRYQLGGDGDFRDQPVERARLTQGLDAILAAGTTYSFRHDQLHRVTPAGDDVVATLVITGHFCTRGSDIYTEHARPATGARLPARCLDPAEIVTAVTRLADLLHQHNSPCEHC